MNEKFWITDTLIISLCAYELVLNSETCKDLNPHHNHEARNSTETLAPTHANDVEKLMLGYAHTLSLT